MIINFNPEIKVKFWAIFSIIIGILFASFIFNNKGYGNISQSGVVQETAEAKTEEEGKEDKIHQYSYFTLDSNKKPKVTAGAFLIGDLATGEIILAKNQDQKFPVASVTKLMTAVISEENQNQEGIMQISKKILLTEGGNGGLQLNEKIKIGDLLYPLLLESSNDAAEAVALYKDRNLFIAKMNEKAQTLDLRNTYFDDTSGLSPNNVSTTLDLFKLTKYIMDNKPDLLKITTNKSYKNENHVWFSNNQFIKEEGYLGGKSGYTNVALETGVSVFSVPLLNSEPRSLAITLLKSKDRRKDVENILSYLKKNIYYGEAEITNASIAKEEEKIPEKEPEFVTLAFAGDIMLDRGVKNSVMKNFGGDYSKLFEKPDLSSLLKKSDIVFANLEGTASDQGRDIGNLHSFRMDPSVIPVLSGAGINILSLANNHIGDWGRESYTNTLSRLRENEILYIGGGMGSEEAEQPATMEKYGIRLGFLGFSDKGPEFMKAGENEAGILLANNPRFDEIIKRASEKVDYLAVSFHWGEGYQLKHNDRQENLAHRAIDNGAKIVIGHHPHVIQDTEVYKNGYIAYSLGNFIFDQAFSKDTMEGLLLEIKLSKDGSMSATKNIVKLNRVFQPESVIKGKEEKIKFGELKIIENQFL